MSTAEQARRYRAGWDEARRRYRTEWARKRRQELGPVYSLANNYKLSHDMAREVLARKPECCELCDRKARLVYDHDHVTGQFRGWICYRCNTGLHMLDDDDLLAKAHAYLEATRAVV